MDTGETPRATPGEHAGAPDLQAHLAAIVDSSEDAIIGKTVAGLITSWNRGAERLYGYTAAEMIGQPIARLIPPDLADDFPRIMARLRRGERIEQYETQRLAKDGTRREVALTISPIQDRTGRLLGASKIARDITARKQAEAELARRRQETALLAEIAQQLSASLDLDTVLHRVVTGAQELCGSERVFLALRDPGTDTLVGRYESGAPPRTSADVRIRPGQGLGGQVLRTGQPWRTADYAADPRFGKEYLAQARADGHLAVLAVPIRMAARVEGLLYASNPACQPFTANDEALLERLATHAALAIQNAQLYQQAQAEVAERRTAEAALARAAAELEQRVADRTAALEREMAERQQAEVQLRQQQAVLFQHEKLAAMGTLLASVAHELNNPLAIILMQAGLLQEEQPDAAQADQVMAITQATERCMRIVRNFLTLARQHPPERHPVALNSVVQGAMELLAYGLQVDTVAVDWRLAPDLPGLWADPHQLHQVVVNLVTNAHQALREIPPPRRLILTTRADPAQSRVLLEVADTGPGIPPAIQAQIFEPFFTTKPPGVGTGLGLPLCRGIIEAHEGSLSVESQPGQGTVFRVALPVPTAGRAGEAPPRVAAPQPASGPASTILVVDDEPGITQALAYLLRRDGHTVATAANGRLALTQLRAQVYDLVLCDLRMPELDGPGLYQALQHAHPHRLPRIIFLTGDTLSPEARTFFDQAGVPRLSKPFRVAEVRQLVQQVLHAAPPALRPAGPALA